MRRPSIVAVGLALVVGTLAVGPTAAAPGDTVADRVFGQGGSFTSNACNLNGISASSLCQPHEAAPAGGALYVADTTNNRVLQYDAALAVGGAAELPLLPGASPEQAGASTEGSGWSGGGYAALAGGLLVAFLVGAGGARYARRRWQR